MFEIRQSLSVYNHAFKLESAERQRLKNLKQNKGVNNGRPI